VAEGFREGYAKDVTETVPFTQVTHVLSCERRETIRVPVSEAQSPGKAEDNAKSPKRVLGDAQLGDDAIRFFNAIAGNAKCGWGCRLPSALSNLYLIRLKESRAAEGGV
jgi:hypothetical protein